MAKSNVNRRWVLRTAVVGGTLGVTGCTLLLPSGDGDGETSTSTPGKATPTVTPTATLTPTEPAPSTTTPHTLTADDGDEEDRFGLSVALATDGSTALIGAPVDEDPLGDGAGSAYVFERSGGSWTQQAKLTADDGDDGDRFGFQVALGGDGNTALVGGPLDEDPNGVGAGSAYVFERSDGSWSQQAKLTADDGDDGDLFGASVALGGAGNVALVGARRDEDPNGDGAGAAYVFERSDGSWSQQAKLTANDGSGGDLFGLSVSVSDDGSTALVGAPDKETPSGEFAGAVYVFGRAGAWTQQAKLTANDGDRGDVFGVSVAVAGDGTTALIGASEDEDPNGGLAGSAYVFARTSGAWSQQSKLAAADGDGDDEFGSAVALSDDGTIGLVGASNDEDPNGDGAGAAYVFERTDGAWTQRSKLVAPDGDDGDRFGFSVSVAGDGGTALLGAFADEDPNGSNAGAAYVFGV